jgi:hypothetical protein
MSEQQLSPKRQILLAIDKSISALQRSGQNPDRYLSYQIEQMQELLRLMVDEQEAESTTLASVATIVTERQPSAAVSGANSGVEGQKPATDSPASVKTPENASQPPANQPQTAGVSQIGVGAPVTRGAAVQNTGVGVPRRRLQNA